MLLGALGALLGAALGGIAAWLLQVYGIDTRTFAGETSIAGVPFDPVWRALLTPAAFVQPVVAMGLTCVLAALYPALLAARLEPVRAMQRV
jgi:ABC-type lipoprotein release transport system permease subunit